MIGEGRMEQVFFTADKKSVVYFFKDQNVARDTMGQHYLNLFCWTTGAVVKPKFGFMIPGIIKNKEVEQKITFRTNAIQFEWKNTKADKRLLQGLFAATIN